VAEPSEPAAEHEERGSEFDAFERLTRKLVQVPKRELDAQRKKAARTNGKKRAEKRA
jgi:hypothetical protein